MMGDMTAKVVGLTGGIACGKSAVVAILRELNVPVVDADDVARDVVAKGTAGLREIVDAFGESILDADGGLDRKKLGAIVFDNENARKTLNAILHPKIGLESMARLSRAAEQEVPYVVYDAALLVENGSYRAFSALVVVAADRATQLARIVARDGLTEEQAAARVAAQMPIEEKIKVADIVIENRGTLNELRARTIYVHELLLKRFQKGDAT